MQNFLHLFCKLVSDLQIRKIHEDYDPVLAAINMLQNHPGVVNIKQTEFNLTFSFKNTSDNEVRKITKNLNVRKTC